MLHAIAESQTYKETIVFDFVASSVPVGSLYSNKVIWLENVARIYWKPQKLEGTPIQFLGHRHAWV